MNNGFKVVRQLNNNSRKKPIPAKKKHQTRIIGMTLQQPRDTNNIYGVLPELHWFDG